MKLSSTRCAWLFSLMAFSAFGSNFMDLADQRTEPLLIRILNHPFVQTLANGTLKVENYRYYKQQDRLYSTRYADVLSALSIRTHNVTVKKFLTKAAIDSLEYGATGSEHDSQQCPSCQAYSDFELSSAFFSFAVGLSAMTPCYTVYERVADWMLQHPVSDNPYQSWMDAWSSSDFKNSVQEIRAIMNQEALKVDLSVWDRMLEAYALAVRYEWQFFNSAWNLAKWEPTNE
ncbi:MAG: TenA family protein [Myxococcaceae bacterium]|nr:TenA family protein [Myxococcaceae bacterium]MBH2006219.1 TenA family protein [Myxococcaceae bacterium]